MARTLRVGVIGAGYWGPNLIRSLQDQPDTELAVVCDKSSERRALIAEHYPTIRISEEPADVLRAKDIDAVVIATPAATHTAMTRTALESGMHVLVEKPFCLKSTEGVELTELAKRQGRILMVGHTFLYNLAVREMRKIVQAQTFGRAYYMHARRTNLGPVREDVHAAWDLASHDISIFHYIKGGRPAEVTASAQHFLRPGVPDVVFATLFYADGTLAYIHASWLDPQKTRQLTVVGESHMVVFDDMNLSEPIRIYNKGVRRTESPNRLVDTFGAFRAEILQGDVVIPPVSTGEPLRLECQAFIESVRSGSAPLSDGALGTDVVRVLEAMDRSIQDQSRRTPVR